MTPGYQEMSQYKRYAIPPAGVLTSKVSQANSLCLMMVVPEQAAGCKKWIYMQKTRRMNRSGEEIRRKARVGPCFSSHWPYKSNSIQSNSCFHEQVFSIILHCGHFVNQVRKHTIHTGKNCWKTVFLEKLEIWIFRFNILDTGYCSYQHSWYGPFNTSL